MASIVQKWSYCGHFPRLQNQEIQMRRDLDRAGLPRWGGFGLREKGMTYSLCDLLGNSDYCSIGGVSPPNRARK